MCPKDICFFEEGLARDKHAPTWRIGALFLHKIKSAVRGFYNEYLINLFLTMFWQPSIYFLNEGCEPTLFIFYFLRFV